MADFPLLGNILPLSWDHISSIELRSGEEGGQPIRVIPCDLRNADVDAIAMRADSGLVERELAEGDGCGVSSKTYTFTSSATRRPEAGKRLNLSNTSIRPGGPSKSVGEKDLAPHQLQPPAVNDTVPHSSAATLKLTRKSLPYPEARRLTSSHPQSTADIQDSQCASNIISSWITSFTEHRLPV